MGALRSRAAGLLVCFGRSIDEKPETYVEPDGGGVIGRLTAVAEARPIRVGDVVPDAPSSGVAEVNRGRLGVVAGLSEEVSDSRSP